MTTEKKTQASFDDGLAELKKDQGILTGMRASLQDFEKKHTEAVAQFMREHIEVSDKATYSLLDIVERVRALE